MRDISGPPQVDLARSGGIATDSAAKALPIHCLRRFIYQSPSHRSTTCIIELSELEAPRAKARNHEPERWSCPSVAAANRGPVRY